MKGPGLRIKFDAKRAWKCPACGKTVRLAGDVASSLCSCTNPPSWMHLLPDPPKPKFSFEKISIPEPPEEEQERPRPEMASKSPPQDRPHRDQERRSQRGERPGGDRNDRPSHPRELEQGGAESAPPGDEGTGPRRDRRRRPERGDRPERTDRPQTQPVASVPEAVALSENSSESKVPPEAVAQTAPPAPPTGEYSAQISTAPASSVELPPSGEVQPLEPPREEDEFGVGL